jgi:hypothetical protein
MTEFCLSALYVQYRKTKLLRSSSTSKQESIRSLHQWKGTMMSSKSLELILVRERTNHWPPRRLRSYFPNSVLPRLPFQLPHHLPFSLSVCGRACVWVPLSLTTENEIKRRKILQLLSSLHKTKNKAKTSANQFYRLQKKIINLLCFPPRRFPCTLATIPSHSCENKRLEIRRRRCSRECLATNTNRDEHHRRLGSCGVLGRFQ